MCYVKCVCLCVQVQTSNGKVMSDEYRSTGIRLLSTGIQIVLSLFGLK